MKAYIRNLEAQLKEKDKIIMTLKNKKLRCYFVENPQSSFYESPIFKRIFSYIGNKGAAKGISIKQSQKYLILVKDNVKSMREARVILQQIREVVLLEEISKKEK